MTTPVGEIRLDLKIDGSNLSGEITEAAQKHVKAALGELNKVLADVQSQMESAGRSGASAASGVSQAGKAARDAVRGMDEMSRATDSAASSTRKAGSAASQASDQFGRFTSAAERASSVGRHLGDGMGKAASGFVRAGDSVLGAVGKFAKWTGIGAAVSTAIGGVAGSFSVLNLGMQRLTSIENARSTLQGLGHDAKSVETIMDSALTSVKGTAFGLGEAATVAASAVAAGVKPGEDLTRTLKLVGDAAAIAKTDMASMGAIFNKVATSNKVQGEVMAQLHDRGIPILQLLAEELGKTAEETQAMASAGEINFETFRNAIEKGMGGAALKAGETFTGAMSNMRAAMGRLGAEILKGPFDSAPAAIGRITEGIDTATDAVKGIVTYLRTGEVSDTFRDVFGDDNVARRVLAGLDRVRAMARQVRDGFRELQAAWRGDDGAAEWASKSVEFVRDSLSRVWEIIRQLGPAIAQVATAFAKATAAVGISTWQILLRTVEGLVPILTMLADVIDRNEGVVVALVAAYALLKVGFVSTAIAARGLSVITSVTSWMTGLTAASTSAATAMGGVTTAVGKLQGFRGQLGVSMLGAGAIGTAVSDSGLGQLLGGLSTVAGGALAGSVFGPIGAGVGAAVGGGIALTSYLLGENARAAKAAADAQAEYQAQIAATERATLNARNAIKDLNDALLASGGEVDETAIAAIQDRIAQMPDLLAPSVNAETVEGVVQAVHDLGLSEQELARIVGGAQPVFDAMLTNLRRMGPDGSLAAQHMQELRDGVVAAQEAAQTAHPALSQLAEKMGTSIPQAAADLRTVFDALPEDVPISIDMENGEAVRQMLQDLGAEVGLIDGKFITLDMDDSDVAAAVQALAGLKIDIERLPNGEVTVNVDTRPGDIAMQSFVERWANAIITPQVRVPGQGAPGGNPLQIIAPGRAGGGVLPGYSPGVDNLLVPMSGGEGVLIPEAVRALGPGFVYALNSMFRPGLSRSGYARGGVIGFESGGVVPGMSPLAADIATAMMPVVDLLRQILAVLGGKPGDTLATQIGDETTTALTSAAGAATSGNRPWMPGDPIPGWDLTPGWLMPQRGAAGVLPGGAGSAVSTSAVAAAPVPVTIAGVGGPQGSKAGLTPAASALWDVIAQNFPQVREIGGVRQDRHPDHPSGRALDIMIPGGTTRGGANPAGKLLGDQMWNFLAGNGLIDPNRSLWQTDTGGDHFDHIHAVAAEGAMLGVRGALMPGGSDPFSSIASNMCGCVGDAMGGLSLLSGQPGQQSPELQALTQALTGAVDAVLPQVMTDVLGAVLGQGDRPLPEDQVSALELIKERNPAALAAMLGYQVGDYNRTGSQGQADDLTVNDGPGFTAGGQVMSDTAALIDRSFTSMEAANQARHQQLMDILTQVRDQLVQIASQMAQAALNAASGSAGQAVPGMAAGGMFRGPGTGTSDSMLARVSNGEFITRAAVVARNPGLFHALNAGLIDPASLPRFATGGGVIVNDVVGAEFFGVSQIPIIGLLVNILVRILLAVLGVQIEARDTLAEVTDEFRQFRGDFKAFDAAGRIFNDTSALADRSMSTTEMATQERIRILKIVISQLIQYIIERVIVPMAKAIWNAVLSFASQAASSAITAGMNAAFPGGGAVGGLLGGLASSAISGIGGAAVEVWSEILSDIWVSLFDVLVDIIGDGLLSYFPNIMAAVFGGGLIEQLIAGPLQLLLNPIQVLLGLVSGGLTALLGSLGGGLAAIFSGLGGSAVGLIAPLLGIVGGIGGAAGGLLGGLGGALGGLRFFDQGGMATGPGFIPKATLEPERVLSPSNTIAFDRLPDKLERLISAIERSGGGSDGASFGDVHIVVDGGPDAGRNVADSLMELVR